MRFALLFAGVFLAVVATAVTVPSFTGAQTPEPTPRPPVEWHVAKLEVVPPGLQSVIIKPVTATIDEGATIQFSAFGLFTDPAAPTGFSEQPLTDVLWVSMDTTVATIHPDTGMATGQKRGTTEIAVGWKP